MLLVTVSSRLIVMAVRSRAFLAVPTQEIVRMPLSLL
jgi:hypothetical protein